MARPLKRLQPESGIIAELWHGSRSTTIGVRDRERAKIILLPLEGLGAEAVAERLNTTPKRVSVWSVSFAASGLDGLARASAAIRAPAHRYRSPSDARWRTPPCRPGMVATW